MLKWQNIKHDRGFYLIRSKVIGGWLVAAVNDVYTNWNSPTTGSEWRTPLTFIPDPNHEWKLEEESSLEPL